MNKLNMNKIYRLFFSLIFCLLLLTAGCGTGPDSSTPAPTPPPSGSTAAYVTISASPTTVDTQGEITSQISVLVLNDAHAVLAGETVTMGADTGILGAATITTGDDGRATVNFSCDADPTNRTATITATAGTVSAQIPVQIVGSKITLTPSGTLTLSSDGSSPAELTVTVSNQNDSPISGASVSLTKTGSGNVTLTPASGTTNDSGTFTFQVAGAAVGSLTLAATSLGATATKEITITAPAASFGIDQLTLNTEPPVGRPVDGLTAMNIGDSLVIRVNAPSIANVTFATSIGTWDGTSAVRTKGVVGGKATATLTTTQTGSATVEVYDSANLSRSDRLTVIMTSGEDPAKILLQASPTTVPKSVGDTRGTSTLTATVLDENNNPLRNQTVAFSIVEGTGSGETVSPVLVTTASTASGGLSLGEARTSFTSGSLPSSGIGVKIRASVVGKAVSTGTAPSGNDAAIVVGGTAGSIAIGRATDIQTDDTLANYIWPMSVLVADSGGNSVSGARVSLKIWPIAWSTGSACTIDPDTATTGTFYNEDANENLILDEGEDGTRIYYADQTDTPGGTLDTYITPVNSAGGTVPATVTTDGNGVAGFNLTYAKTSAIWIIVRIRASALVQGTETVSEQIFRLPGAQNDISPNCKLPDSPFRF